MRDGSAMRRAIARKRDGFALDPSQWRSIVSAYLAGGVDDAQMAALLMASLCRGLNEDETLALTDAFVASGETLRPPGARVVDKHSSGGVGDSTSLIVVPWVAACGVVVAKLSGRALGHTGGTLDKMEAVEGVRTELEPHEFFVCLERAGCAIAAQSARLVPADKRIYALRDRTATVPSLGLIAASIASKKIAGGAHAIVYDVKTGRGALLPRFDQARRLAETLVELSERFGRGATALVSDMDEPLGPSIGTGLEVCEARDFLRGRRRDPRLETLCFALAEAMLRVVSFPGDARAALRRALAGGAAADVARPRSSSRRARAARSARRRCRRARHRRRLRAWDRCGFARRNGAHGGGSGRSARRRFPAQTNRRPGASGRAARDRLRRCGFGARHWACFRHPSARAGEASGHLC
jgi:pyrimidine-nucleoside phosphorylase